MSLKTPRIEMDVSDLPDTVFGHRNLMFWGTLGFMVVEGFTLCLVAASYLYLRRNEYTWPPEGTPLPTLSTAVWQVGVMLLSLVPITWSDRIAQTLDRRKMTIALALASILGLVICWLRWEEFWALNVRWDANAYASMVWSLLGFHATLLVLEVGETVGTTVFFLFSKRVSVRNYSDMQDNAMYWWFMILAWLPLFFLVDILPRIVK